MKEQIAVIMEQRICQAPGCERLALTRGYCPRHYQQIRRCGRLTPEREYSHRNERCGVEHCQAPQVAKGYCFRHYQQIRRHGQLTPEREHIWGRTGCQIPGCPNPHSARGYCRKHYNYYYFLAQGDRTKGNPRRAAQG